MIDMAELSETFRVNVRKRMRESDPPISGVELARRMGVSPQYVNGYLTGASPRDPGLGVLAKFAAALRCEPHELIESAKIPA